MISGITVDTRFPYGVSTHVPDEISGIQPTKIDAYTPYPAGYPKYVRPHESHGHPPFPQWADYHAGPDGVLVLVHSPAEEAQAVTPAAQETLK
jgi:hypothetical protein